MRFLTRKPVAGWLFATLAICQLSFVAMAQPTSTLTPYGIKGAGASNCSHFVATVTEKDAGKLNSYAGWVDGYVTALNMSRADTFDLVPWQSTETLLNALHKFCQQAVAKNEGQLPFHLATQAMTRSLHAQRLQAASNAIFAGKGEKGVVVYQYVLDQLRGKLEQQGLLITSTAGQAFDTKTADALIGFQRRNGMPESGLPDQATLALLFATGMR